MTDTILTPRDIRRLLSVLKFILRAKELQKKRGKKGAVAEWEKKLSEDYDYIHFFDNRNSAICTALVAAPFLKLSLTIQQLTVF